MTPYEIATFTISTFALIGSIVAIWISSKADNKATRFTEGANEMQYRQLIISTTKDMLDRKEKYEANPNQANIDALLISVENYLNVYDDLCSLFINKNVDSIHFFRKYRNDIKNLVEDKEFKDYYFPKEISKYVNTVRVYEHFEKSNIPDKILK